MSHRIHADEAAHAGVRSAALAEMTLQLQAAEQALMDDRPWLMGERWCIADAHVTWAVDRARTTGLSLDALPNVAALLERQMARPTWRRAVSRETAAV
jgi:glutathione S-transferase